MARTPNNPLKVSCINCPIRPMEFEFKLYNKKIPINIVTRL